MPIVKTHVYALLYTGLVLFIRTKQLRFCLLIKFLRAGWNLVWFSSNYLIGLNILFHSYKMHFQVYTFGFAKCIFQDLKNAFY